MIPPITISLRILFSFSFCSRFANSSSLVIFFPFLTICFYPNVKPRISTFFYTTLVVYDTP